MPEIGTLNENPLHAALKQWYARPGDALEASVDGFVVDIVRGDLLVEIQTANFAAIRPKLAQLVSRHPVRLVYPVAQEKWIARVGDDGQTLLGRRRSPCRGAAEDVFAELIRLPRLLGEPNFSLEVLLVQEEDVRRFDPAKRRRRGGWATCERRLLAVVGQRLFETPAALAALLPDGLPEPFTTADLAAALRRPRRLAGQMAYCLRKMGQLRPVGKRGHAILYTRAGRGVTILGSEPLR